MPNPVTFSPEVAARIGRATRWFETHGMDLAQTDGRRLSGDQQCVFAKLTNKTGTRYAWSQAWPSSADGSWAVRSDPAAASGTASSQPAVDLNSSDTTDFTNKFAVLVRCRGSDGKPCWIIAGIFSGTTGYTGSVTVVTAVTWDGTSLKQTAESLTFTNGLLTSVGTAATTTIDTATAC